MESARARARRALREAVLEKAVAQVSEGGWESLRMADVAAAVGVSRQTVHNEFGTKAGLGEALVHRETQLFLDAVRARLAMPDEDPLRGVEEALAHTFTEAAGNPLLHAVLTSTRGGGGSLLPLLTTRSEPLLQAASGVLRGHLQARLPEVPDASLDVVVDALVRLSVSHLVLPSSPPAETARRLTDLARTYLQSLGEPTG